MDQSFDRAAVLGVVEDDRRVRLVPVPRIVPVVLEVGDEFARVRVQRDRGRREEVVARTLVAEPRGRVAGAPVGQVQRRIVGAGTPDRPAALLPRIAGPRLATFLSGGGDRVRLPRRLAGIGIEGRDEAPDAELATGDADHDLALGDERGQRHVVAGLPVFDLLLPRDLAGAGVQRDQHAVVGGQVNLVAVERHSATGVVEDAQPLGHLALVPPQQPPGLRLHGDDLVVRRGDEHDAVVHEEGSLVTGVDTGRKRPDRRQLLHVLNVDLVKRTVRPALVIPAGHQPVARFRLGELPVGDRTIGHDPLGVRQHG